MKDKLNKTITENSTVAFTNRSCDCLLVGEVIRMGKKQVTILVKGLDRETRALPENCVVVKAA